MRQPRFRRSSPFLGQTPSKRALDRVHPGFPKAVNLITADQAGVGRTLLHRDKNNFAPRFGFAWRPGFAEDLVIRGGAGIYYAALHPFIGQGGGAPYELSETITNQISGGQSAFSFPKPFPGSTFELGGTGAQGVKAGRGEEQERHEGEKDTGRRGRTGGVVGSGVRRVAVVS